MKKLFLTLLVAALAIFPFSAAAHHGVASSFDTTKEITVNGMVTDFHFVNPHCVIEFDAKDYNGQMQSWKAELTSPIHLSRRGWTEGTVQPGDQITITGYRAKNGAPSIWVNKVVLANGQELKGGFDN